MNIVATEAGGGNMEINKTDFHIPAARRLRDQLISLNQLAKGYALRGQGHRTQSSEAKSHSPKEVPKGRKKLAQDAVLGKQAPPDKSRRDD
jgi:hypothetical protein